MWVPEGHTHVNDYLHTVLVAYASRRHVLLVVIHLDYNYQHTYDIPWELLKITASFF
jgi:hypothetical protein